MSIVIKGMDLGKTTVELSSDCLVNIANCRVIVCLSNELILHMADNIRQIATKPIDSNGWYGEEVPDMPPE